MPIMVSIQEASAVATISVGEKASPFPLLSTGASVISWLPDLICFASVRSWPMYTTSAVIYSYFSVKSCQLNILPVLLLPIVLFVFGCLSISVQAQNVDKYTEEDYVRTSEWSLGLKIHTNGYGINYNWGKIDNIRKKSLWQIEVQEIKHSKEFRRQSVYKDYPFQPPTARSYTFGKINNFYNLNISKVWQRVLARKGRKSGVSISLLYKAGLSLGVAKPYQLNLVLNVDALNQPDIQAQTFEESPDLFLRAQAIYGGTNFIKGFEKASLYPGGVFKLGFLFDWAQFNERVKAIELGAMVNVYYKRVPIMAAEENHFLYGNLYLKFLFGKRK